MRVAAAKWRGQLGEHRPAVGLVGGLDRLGQVEVQARPPAAGDPGLDGVPHDGVLEAVDQRLAGDAGEQPGRDELGDRGVELVRRQVGGRLEHLQVDPLAAEGGEVDDPPGGR